MSAAVGRSAVLTIAHGRHRHLRRQIDHVRTVFDGIYVVVAIGDADLRGVVAGDAVVREMDTAAQGLPLAAARNLAATEAIERGADQLVFLDVDCLPDPELLQAYRAQRHLPSLLAGPVTYLPSRSLPAPGADLAALRRPHPARPVPAAGQVRRGGDKNLFWSLNFAVSAHLWGRIGGFCDEYVGYGGEDTDLAYLADAAGIDLAWVGSAHAYHQFHPSSSPPTEHLVAIVRNSNLFHRRWGEWPMGGWLEQFAAAGLVTWTPDRLELTPTRLPLPGRSR